MLKVQWPIPDGFKCGEVLLFKTEYLISCVQCEKKIKFNDFQRHFRNLHLTRTQRRQLQNLLNQCEIGTKVEEPNSTDMEVEGEDDLECLDEHLIDIEQLNPVEALRSPVPQSAEAATTITAITDADSEPSSDEFELTEPVPDDYDSIDADDNKSAAATVDNNETSDDDFEREEPAEGHSSSDDFASSSSDEASNQFPCTMCDRDFKSKQNLGDHLRRVHKMYKETNNKKMKVPDLNPPYKCETCGVGFRDQISLKRHDMSKHTGIKCDICGRSFSQIPNMESHMKRHTGIKEFKCEYCGKEYFTKKERDSHSLVHTKNYRKVCEICGKPCLDGGALTAHMRRHTGERPFKCKVCGKGFFSGYDRNIHESGHSDERPFKCEICGGAFRYKRALRVHKKIHVKERNFACHICDKRFINEKGVKEHMRSHTKTLIQKEEEDQQNIIAQMFNS